jgi:hypothetical protein
MLEKTPNTLSFIPVLLGDLQDAVEGKLPTTFLPKSKERWDTFKKETLDQMGISAFGS